MLSFTQSSAIECSSLSDSDASLYKLEKMFNEENYSSEESASDNEISSDCSVHLHDNVLHARARRNAIDFSPMDLGRNENDCDSIECAAIDSNHLENRFSGSFSTEEKEMIRMPAAEEIESVIISRNVENFNNNSNNITRKNSITVCQTTKNSNCSSVKELEDGQQDAVLHLQKSDYSNFLQEFPDDEDIKNENRCCKKPLCNSDSCLNDVSVYCSFKKSCHNLCNVSVILSSKFISNVSLTHPNALQTKRTITAKRLLPQLEYCFAYMHGGKDHSNAPIICLPHYPDLRLITDDDFQDVFLYLTSIASVNASEFGFVLVLDRRRDKWPSVRGVLVRLANFFPGSLKMVLILRPSGFFQGTISDLGFRFHRDEFLMKVPITMLSTLDELHNYVRPEQLTQEFGGSYDYDHKTWMRNRVLLEDFSSHATEVGCSLNDFGLELAQTELPNDVVSTQELIKTQQESVNVYKDKLDTLADAASGLKETVLVGLSAGSILPESQSEHEIQTLNEMISLVKNTKNAFNMFWAKHSEKLKQCLQLRKFEQDYREARFKLTVFEQWHEHQNKRVETSMSWLRSLIAETEHLKESFNVCRAKCLELADEGQSLIRNHYAVDCVAPKCDELHQISSDLADAFRKRLLFLGEIYDLLTSINKLNDWCDCAMSLLAGQTMEKTQSVDGAQQILSELNAFFYADKRKLPIPTDSIPANLENCVQAVNKRHGDVERLYEKCRSNLCKTISKHAERPIQKVEPSKKAVDLSDADDANRSPQGEIKTSESSPPKITRSSPSSQSEASVMLQHAMNELLSTERIYVEELKAIVEGYGGAINDEKFPVRAPKELIGNQTVLLGNMEEIYRFHNMSFLAELENCQNEPHLVGRCFIKREADFSMYAKYCLNSADSEQLRAAVGEKHPFFMECQKKLGHRLSLSSYLLKPVQRITKYQLLLQQIAKYSTSHRAELQQAVRTMLNVLKSVNDSMHQAAIVGYQGDFESLGRLMLQGPLQIEQKKLKGKNLARPRFNKTWHRHVFLYEKEMLLCKSHNVESGGSDNGSSGASQVSSSLSTGTKHQRYLFKTSLKMNGAGITDNIKGDLCKFEIWYQAREDVYTFQTHNAQLKQDWLKEIRRVLESQPKVPQPKVLNSSKSAKRSQSLNRKSRPFPSHSERRQRIKSEKIDSKRIQGLSRSASMGKGKDKLLKTRNSDEHSKQEILKSEDELSIEDDSENFIDKPKSASMSKITDEVTDVDVDEGFHSSIALSSENSTGCRYVVMKERADVNEEEVALKVGDIVQVIEFVKEGWVKVRVEHSGSVGWAPTNHIRSLSDASSFDSVSSYTSS